MDDHEGSVLTLSEIEECYQNEWVLLDNPETTEKLEIVRGTVVGHSRRRDEVYQTAKRLGLKNCAIFFAGGLRKDRAYLL